MALTGDVKALIQNKLGIVLAGTNNSARVYVSGDNGQSWIQVAALGSGSDSINAFARTRSTGTILAAVSGSVTAQGIWRSVDNGYTWTKVKSHPASTGYYDITSFQETGRYIAVGAPISGTPSAITYSNNDGVTWATIPTNFNQSLIAVAAPLETVLPSLYAGESNDAVFQPPIHFVGSAGGTSTGMYGYPATFSPSSNGFAFSTRGGSAGGSGLDMAAFVIKNAQGSYWRRALWAVKSVTDSNNTEIWQWPTTVAINSFNDYAFAKVQTIVGAIFNVLYVDPAYDWTTIGSARTVWAGANGSIYVSYNSGLSWSLATTAPTGQIYSFLRTTAGVLIAGGASGEIFLFGGSGSEGGGGTTDPGEETPTIPTPTQPGLAMAQVLGQESTDEEKIYIANKFSFSNLTHIFYYSGSTWSNIQYSNLPPYSFLGTGGTVGRIVYFGSKTTDSNVPGGPFSNLVFDLVQEARNLTVVWEYWNGTFWASLTTTDNTEGFRKLGVNNVTWQIPSNWTALMVNTVTGYWVRARITAVGSDPQTPIQANRFIYTANLPYLNIASNEIQGDLPALGRMVYRNRGLLDIERLVCGLRRADRGSNFNAYINISDVQTPFGLTITPGSASGIAWAADIKTPTARGLLVNISGSDLNTWTTLATIKLDNTVARDYYGHYHAYLRGYYNHASINAWNLRLKILFGSGGGQSYSQTVYPTSLSSWEAFDLGQIAIPTTQLAYTSNNLGDQVSIVIEGYCTTASRPMSLYDLILIPTDEWAIDTRLPQLVTSGTPQLVNNYYLEIDSISNPKAGTLVYNRNSAGQIVSRYQAINNGPMMMQKNADQRFWYLAMAYESYWRAYPEIIASTQIFKLQQYLGFRGTN